MSALAELSTLEIGEAVPAGTPFNANEPWQDWIISNPKVTGRDWMGRELTTINVKGPDDAAGNPTLIQVPILVSQAKRGNPPPTDASVIPTQPTVPRPHRELLPTEKLVYVSAFLAGKRVMVQRTDVTPTEDEAKAVGIPHETLVIQRLDQIGAALARIEAKLV